MCTEFKNKQTEINLRIIKSKITRWNLLTFMSLYAKGSNENQKFNKFISQKDIKYEHANKSNLIRKNCKENKLRNLLKMLINDDENIKNQRKPYSHLHSLNS